MKAPLRQPPPPPKRTWWAEPLTREEWTAKAAERAKEMNVVTTTQHVQRREGDA